MTKNDTKKLYDSIIDKCMATIQKGDFRIEASSENYYTINGQFSIGSNHNGKDSYLHVKDVEIDSKEMPYESAIKIDTMWHICDKKWQSMAKTHAIQALVHLDNFATARYGIENLKNMELNQIIKLVVQKCTNILNSNSVRLSNVTNLYTVYKLYMVELFSIGKDVFGDRYLTVKNMRVHSAKLTDIPLATDVKNLHTLCEQKYQSLEHERCEKALKSLEQPDVQKRLCIFRRVKGWLTKQNNIAK